MTPGPDAGRADPQGSHSGQWGLAALLLGSVILMLFPIAVATMLGLLIGAWNINQVELHHIQFAVAGGRIVVYGLLGLAALSVACGAVGLSRAARRRQPFGLAVAGTAVGLLAATASVVLVMVGEYVAEDTHRLRSEHPRFRPADAALVEEVKSAVAQDPRLRADWDRAMKDGVLTELEADDILVKAGRRIRPPK